MDPTVALKLLGQAAVPPAFMVFGLLIGGVLALVGRKKLAWLVAALAVFETVVLALPPITDLMMGPLEREAREAAAKARPCCYDAIVVLGGGVTPAVPPWLPDPDLNWAADRVWMAARLYRQGLAAKVIVSGGNILAEHGGVHSMMTEAEGMKRFLTDLGVPGSAIVSESSSINTRDNIAFVRALVQDKPVALVTSGYHMPRALGLARRGGLNASAFPTDWHAPWQARPYWQNWLPTAEALVLSVIAAREYLALAFDYRAVP
jgi:uncharacterized SAM-binding protein YcdF (DUF218 family)